MSYTFASYHPGCSFECEAGDFMKLYREIGEYNAISRLTGELVKIDPALPVTPPADVRKWNSRRPVEKTLAAFKMMLPHALLHAQLEYDERGIAIVWDAREGWRMFNVRSWEPPTGDPMMPWSGPPAFPKFAIVTADGVIREGEAFEILAV